MSGALEGIRVLDLGRFIAAPLCAQILGDMGAQVIKLERPSGEDARKHAPFYQGESIYTMVFNRNKHAITLDTRHPDALPVLERLLVASDVLVENYRPGTLAEMGLSYERLHELNPRLVVTSLSGFGQTGPSSQRALFDAIAQAESGLMSLTGEAGGAPTLAGTYVADYVTGLYGAIGTLTALHARSMSGLGQVVDIASLDAIFSCLGTHPWANLMLGLQPERTGSRDQHTAPASVFEAADGYVYIHAGTNPLFPRLCEVMGRPELAAVEAYRDVPGRMAHAAELESDVAAWTRSRTVATVTELLERAGIPCAPIAEIEDVVRSPQLRAREMMVEIEHPKLGALVVPGIPVKLRGNPGSIRKAPPMVGEDNAYVYRELLGYTEAEFAALKSSGAL